MTRLLSREQLRESGVAFSDEWLRRLEQEGKFPKRVKLGDRRVVWVADEVAAWVASRIAAGRESGAASAA
jgi:prophage regulatory protein